MTNSSIVGGRPAPRKAPGRDVDALGPSDSSDSGSDIQGERRMATEPDNPGELGTVPVERDSDSDALGTGERGPAQGGPTREAPDISPDRIDRGAAGAVAGDDDVELLADDEAALDDAIDEEDESAEGGAPEGPATGRSR